MRKLPVFGNIPRLLRFFSGCWTIYYPCIILSVLFWPVMSYLQGYLMGGMMQSAIDMTIAPVLSRLPLFGAGIAVIAVTQIFAKYGRDVSLERGAMSLRDTLLSHILKLPVATMQKKHSGNYLAQFTIDSNAAIRACDQSLDIIGMLAVSNVVSVSYIFACSSLLGWVTIGVGIMSLIFNGAFAPYIRKLNIVQRGRMAELSERLSDLLGGHTLARTDNREEYFIGRTGEAVENVFDINWKIKKTGVIASTPAELSKFLIDGVILAAAILLFTQGELSPDQVMTCCSLGTTVGFTMRGIAQRYLRMQEQLASADRVGDLLDEKEETEGAQTAAIGGSVAVSARDVHFNYREDLPLFSGLNIDFPAGQSSALVGTSGGGKSTLALMLLRFYDPGKGVVEVFGRDAKDYTLEALRSLSAYVPQNPHLFDGTVWENIRFGKMDATDEEILKAAQLARVDVFVDELPDGYHTRVGERGAQLSGGQRQRVAIARALLKRAPILLLDEATASLDNNIEQDIQHALASLSEDQTIITIVHRLSTATGNDRINVIEGGGLLEAGSHDELLAADGRYAKLWRANQSKAED